jgi:hypothetical protein
VHHAKTADQLSQGFTPTKNSLKSLSLTWEKRHTDRTTDRQGERERDRTLDRQGQREGGRTIDRERERERERDRTVDRRRRERDRTIDRERETEQ